MCSSENKKLTVSVAEALLPHQGCAQAAEEILN